MEPDWIFMFEVSRNECSPLKEEPPGQGHEYPMDEDEIDEGGVTVCLL